jgi:hypothetical protein
MGFPCFALESTSIDWPAWVQAIGSIVAIVASAGVAFWLHFEAANSEKARRRKAGALSVMYANGIRWGLDEMIAGAQANPPDEGRYVRGRATLEETMQIPFPNGFELLPENVLVAFLGVRGIGAEVRSAPVTMFGPIGPPVVASLLGQIQDRSHQRRAELDAALQPLGIDPNVPF